MAIAARYFDLVREMKNAYNHRLRLAESARQRASKQTAGFLLTRCASGCTDSHSEDPLACYPSRALARVRRRRLRPPPQRDW